jgi:hypothetical protein
MKWTEEDLIIMIMDAREGKLDEYQLAELRTYIEENALFEDYQDDLPSLIPDNQSFDKEKLYKSSLDNVQAYDEIQVPFEDKLIIGQLEDMLNVDELDLMRFKQKEHEFSIAYKFYQITKLVPDTTVLFTQKEKLKRNIPLMSLNVRFFSGLAAASVALLICFSVYTTKRVKVTDTNSAGLTVKALDALKRTKKKVLNVQPTKPVVSMNSARPAVWSEQISGSGLPTMLEAQNESEIPGPPAFEVPRTDVRETTGLTDDIPHEFSSVNPNESRHKNYDNLWAFVKGKVKKIFFGDELITQDAQVSDIFRKASEQTGLDVAYNRTKYMDQDILYFKFGAISVERKRSN